MAGLRGVVALAAAMLVLVACGSTRMLYSNVAFAYSNATPMLSWFVGDYVDMSDGQKDWVRERIGRLMALHRARELPAYRRFLEAMAARASTPFTEEQVGDYHRQLREHYDRTVALVVPDIADFLLQLDDEQVDQLERKFAADNRKLSGESVVLSAEERTQRAVKRNVEHLEQWVGELTDAQRELVAARVREYPDVSAERLTDRRYRQSQTLSLLRAKADREQMIAGLRRLLIESDTWRDPQFARKLRERDAKSIAMVAAVSASLSPEQRAFLERRLRGFAQEITQLSASLG